MVRGKMLLAGILATSVLALSAREVTIVEVPSEIGAGTRGASMGCDAVKTASLNAGSDYYAKRAVVRIENENNCLFEPVRKHYARRIEGLVKVYERLAHKIKQVIVDTCTFPFVIAGDHSTGGGTIAGVKMAYPDKRIGVVWIDAHADIHSPYTTPSGNTHGMPVATAIAEDNKECLRNEVDNATTKEWEKLKNIGGIAPKVDPKDIVYIAVRDTEKEEDYLLSKYGMTNITVAQLRKMGVEKAVHAVLQKLKDCDYIYISFDVDGMDMSVSEGTGTPVKDGIMPNEAQEILKGIIKSGKVCCLEITEINPTLDEKNTMADCAFNIMRNITGYIEQFSQG